MRSSAFSSHLFPLAGLVFLIVAAADSPSPSPSPFAGQWTILVPQQFEEVSLWIVHIDKQGKQARILAGLRQYDTTTVRAVKTTSKRLALSLTRGSHRFDISVEGIPATNKRLLGSVRIGSTILPGWLEPTSQARLDEKKAVRPPLRASGI